MSVHAIKDARFVCTAEADARCRNYPACDCETWTDAHAEGKEEPGHEAVPQPECWLDGWLNSFDLADTYYGPEGEEDAHGMTFPDGPIEHDFDGDSVTWRYADETRPVWDEDDE